MSWHEQRWIRQQMKRLRDLGAPRSVVSRWQMWLAAVSELPASSTVREWITAQLDDEDAPMPEPTGALLN